jgi:KTSC domain-containing protein
VNRQQVRSSNVVSVGFDGTTLEVEFKGGKVYQYKGVPQTLYDELISAPSIGKYMRDYVIGNYSSVKQSS